MPAGAQIYTPGTTGSQFANVNVNAIGSKYAQVYGHGATSMVQRIVRETIYDAAPKQFIDLKILAMKSPRKVDSDEFSYFEVGYGREPILLDAQVVGGGASQALTILNIESVNLDLIVIYEDGSRGTITAIDPALKVITVTAETGSTLPALNVAAAGDYQLANHSPVERDGADYFNQYYRIDTVERWNYVQFLLKAQRFGRAELHKYLNAGGTLGKNYIALQRKRMMEHFRVDLSNIFWNGNMAEVTLADGQKAKTAGGVNTIMQLAGSPNTTVAIGNAKEAIVDLALSTEYGSHGDTKFLYATHRIIQALNDQFKGYSSGLLRYAPNDEMVKLNLNSIDIGSSKIVLVPMKRFEDMASFPPYFRSRVFLLDQNSIVPVVMFGEEMGSTLQRGKNGSYRNYLDTWISSTFSIEFNNPVGSAYADITGVY